MRFVPARICALLVVCLATAAVAQERVYFAELNAPRIQTLTFDGTQWQRDPSTLPGGVDPFGIAATDHLFLPAPGFSGLALDAVDPATGLEIHRISTTIDI